MQLQKEIVTVILVHNTDCFSKGDDDEIYCNFVEEAWQVIVILFWFGWHYIGGICFKCCSVKRRSSCCIRWHLVGEML